MNVKYNKDNTMDSLDQIHHVLIIEDPSFRREINLDAATYSIGRHSSNDIVLSCQKTSRNHATLLRRTDVKTNKFSYWVLDGDLQGNRSRNGIYINGKKTLVHELKNKDVIQFSGDAQAIYQITADLPSNASRAESLENLPLAIENNTFINKDTIVAPVAAAPSNSSSRTALVDSSRQISLTELSPQPIIEIDLYGNITYINSAGIINFKDIHHRKLNHPLLENLISIYHQGEDNIVNREVKIGSKTFWQTAHYLPDNKVIRNYIVDITQQKKLEAELEYKKSIYDQINQYITDGIILVESTTKQIVEISSSCSELLGYSSDRLLQMNIYELSCVSEKFSAVLQRVIAEKNSFSGECLLRHQTGDSIKAQVKINLIDSGDKETICLIVNNLDKSQIVSSDSQNISSSNLSPKSIFDQQIETAIANAKRS
ncbi:MAG: FHA domain-containing protein [Pleurocapsa sp.]